MIVDPYQIVNDKALLLASGSKVQQSGIDVTIKSIKEIWHSTPTEIQYSQEISLPSTLLEKRAFDFTCHEFVEVPKNMVALLFIRSTYNRRGAFITTGLYDNGFKNFIGGVLHTMAPLILEKDARIGQIVFFKTEHTAQYDGSYQYKK